jgi:hypothetical protein
MSHAYDRIGSFIHVNPYAIAFCYIDPTAVTNLPPKGFIIKGGLKNVEKTITKYNFSNALETWYIETNEPQILQLRNRSMSQQSTMV